MTADVQPRTWRPWVKLLASVLVLGPCLYGFGNKFWEMINTYRSESDGAFAIAPIVNYILASAGFLLMLIWAAANGMFHDIEQPKQTMLDNESRLDGWPRGPRTSKKDATP